MTALQPLPSSVLARVSVALCTYNGERHLLEQLESIRQQTRLPDELIVCDDHSTDGSMEIVREFATRAPFAVRVVVNDTNLGSTRNFEQAIQLATGDIILLCDQDDVWLPEKVLRFTEMFATYPAIEGFFSNAWLVRSAQERTAVDLWSVLGITGERRRLATTDQVSELMVHGNVAFGTVFGIRASARASVLPIPLLLPGGHLHDGWIAMVLTCRKTLRGFDEKLSLYRQHEQQQVGVTGRGTGSLWGRLRTSSQVRRHILAEQRATLERFYQLLRENPFADGFDYEPLTAIIAHLRMRLELPRPRWQRLRPVLSAVLRAEYRRYSASLGSPLRDLFL